MEHSGTLKKRRQRSLAKVAGLSQVPYNENNDSFDGTAIFTSTTNFDINKAELNVRGESSKKQDTVIGIARLLKGALSLRPNFRVTRDPTFHQEVENGDDESSPHGLPSLKEERQVLKTRPYFLDRQTIARLRQIIFLGICSGAFPWTWNSKKHRIERWAPAFVKGWKVFCILVALQHAFLGTWQLYNTISAITNGQQKSYRPMFMNLASVFLIFSLVCFNINMFLYEEQIRKYVNTLFRFNKQLMEKYVVDLQDYTDSSGILIKWNIPMKFVELFVGVLLFLQFPYHHRYLTSRVLPKPWYWLIPGAWQQFVAVGQVSANYTLFQWIMFAHANSIGFWLKEIHQNNESSYTLDTLRHPKVAVETYRSLQIVCIAFNNCMSPLLIPVTKMYSSLGLIPYGFVFVRSFNTFFKELPAILVYPFGIVGYSIASFCTMSLPATMLDLSCGFIDSWGQTKHKDFRRILMSCSMLKVKVARFYFITRDTTVTFFNIVVGYVIDCLLTFS